MMIELTVEEAKILREALTGEVSELSMEISNTDQKDFRDPIKRRKEILIGVLNKLKEIAA